MQYSLYWRANSVGKIQKLSESLSQGTTSITETSTDRTMKDIVRTLECPSYRDEFTTFFDKSFALLTAWIIYANKKYPTLPSVFWSDIVKRKYIVGVVRVFGAVLVRPDVFEDIAIARVAEEAEKTEGRQKRKAED